MNQPSAPCRPPRTNNPASFTRQPPINPAADGEPDAGHEEGDADQPAPQTMDVFEPEDFLESR